MVFEALPDFGNKDKYWCPNSLGYQQSQKLLEADRPKCDMAGTLPRYSQVNAAVLNSPDIHLHKSLSKWSKLHVE